MNMSTRADLLAAEKSRAGAKTWTWLARGIFATLVLLALVTVGYLMFSNISLRAQVVTANAERDEAVNVSNALYEQLLDAGEEPIAEPQETLPAEPGPAGPVGSQGLPGRAPTQGEIANGVLTVCTQTNVCKGQSGDPGADGAAGETGAAGADGAAGSSGSNGADGATGPAGPAGEPGPQGEPGSPGADGATGPQGPAGPACPEGSTLTTVYVFTSESDLGIPASWQQAAICSID